LPHGKIDRPGGLLSSEIIKQENVKIGGAQCSLEPATNLSQLTAPILLLFNFFCNR